MRAADLLPRPFHHLVQRRGPLFGPRCRECFLSQSAALPLRTAERHTLFQTSTIDALLPSQAQAAASQGQTKTKANVLAAFGNLVQAQTGKSITSTNAAVLIQLANVL